MTIGDKIKNRRNAKSISQIQLADKMNVSVQTVYNWESGQNQPTYENLKNLSVVLDIGINYFFDCDNNSDDLATAAKDVAHQKINYKKHIITLSVVTFILVALAFACYVVGSIALIPTKGADMVVTIFIEENVFYVLLTFTVLWFLMDLTLFVRLLILHKKSKLKKF